MESGIVRYLAWQYRACREQNVCINEHVGLCVHSLCSYTRQPWRLTESLSHTAAIALQLQYQSRKATPLAEYRSIINPASFSP